MLCLCCVRNDFYFFDFNVIAKFYENYHLEVKVIPIRLFLMNDNEGSQYEEKSFPIKNLKN